MACVVGVLGVGLSWCSFLLSCRCGLCGGSCLGEWFALEGAVPVKAVLVRGAAERFPRKLNVETADLLQSVSL